jgi:hypothetical protein
MPDPALHDARLALAHASHALYVCLHDAPADDARRLYRDVHSAVGALLASLFDPQVALEAKQNARELRGARGRELTDSEVSDVYEMMTCILVPQVSPEPTQEFDT